MSCTIFYLTQDYLNVPAELDIFNMLVRWSRKECQRRPLEVNPVNQRMVLGDALYRVGSELCDLWLLLFLVDLVWRKLMVSGSGLSVVKTREERGFRMMVHQRKVGRYRWSYTSELGGWGAQ